MEDFIDVRGFFNDFADKILGMSVDSITNGGGVNITLPNGKWSIGIYASPELCEIGTYENCVVPLARLFRERADLLEGIVDADSFFSVVEASTPLSEWLETYGFMVGIRGLTLWTKLQLLLNLGISKLLNFVGI